MNFAKTLKDLLQEHSINQSTLANAIGFSQRAVSKWVNEQAEPTETAIVSCADYFEITIDEMLGKNNITTKTTKKPDGLTPDELALLEDFRMRPRPEQAQAAEYVHYLAQRQKSIQKKKA